MDTLKGTVELADAIVREDGTDGSKAVERVALTTPTQVRRPWRSTVRTIFQATVSLAAMWGLIIEVLNLPDWAWVGTSVAVAGGITRLMALPAVEEWLRRFFPFLAAAPDPGNEADKFADQLGGSGV